MELGKTVVSGELQEERRVMRSLTTNMSVVNFMVSIQEMPYEYQAGFLDFIFRHMDTDTKRGIFNDWLKFSGLAVDENGRIIWKHVGV